jgi:tetratricopeptide (TPR) repeat protein
MLAEYGSEEGVMALLATEQGRKCALHESEHGKPVQLAAWGGHRGLVEALLPHSGCQESVDELMAWGKARAAAYEEEQRVAAENNSGKGQQHGHLGDRDVHHHGAMGLPPPAASAEAAAEAQRKKEAANRAFVAGEFEAALALYGEAIALDGRDPAFWSNRSGCLMKLGKFAEALADAELARALKPDWPKACYRMAAARLALKRYEDAALAAYEGIQLDGGDQALHKLLRQAIDLGREEHQQKHKDKAGEEKKGK